MHRQKHRGVHPKDEKLFAPEFRPTIGQAIIDLYFLYSRQYSESIALRLVGDHFLLHKRQRFALQKIVSSKDEINNLFQSEINEQKAIGQHLAIDGFNLLIFMEVLLSDGFIFQCLDGTYRDIASVHGSYHQIIETDEAILQLGKFLQRLQPKSLTWFLDRPVSNSGKLANHLREISQQEGWNWTVEIVSNPDQAMLALKQTVLISNDRIILSRSENWYNLSKILARDIWRNNSHLIELAQFGITDTALQRINYNLDLW